ncbi:MAG: hypothetical protein ACI8XB_001838 [Patiriisocius sp.]|jgi:hypothetical protein
MLGKITSLTIATILFCSIVYSQNNDSFFKVIPSLDNNLPEWTHLMYSEDPVVDIVVRLYHEYYKENSFEKNIHTQNFKFWLKSIEDKIGQDGRIRPVSTKAMRLKFESISSQKNSSSSLNTVWESAGPFETYNNNGSLETRPTQTNIFCLAVAPSNHDILFCGAATGGGIFKSLDHGLSWSLVTLDYPIVDANDIKIHPANSDIVYASQNQEVYQTIDGGLTWQLIFNAPDQVEQFYIHRTQPNIVFAATKDGLFKSIDDGVSWSNIFNERCWDIEPHPINPDIIYLSTHNSIAKKAEVYKSDDNGLTWTLKDNQWYVPTDMAFAEDYGCKIGVSPADPERLYAALIGNSKDGDQGWIGIYYSLNGGDTWVNSDGIDGGPYDAGNDVNTNWYYAGYSSGYHQGWYNFDLDVSHVNPDKLWIGTIWSCESGNRGANIEYIRGTRNLSMHADVQDIDVVGNEIWYTSDGGINYSTDEMQTVETRNYGISASTYWGFNQGWNEDVWVGGRYHNGNAIFHEGFGDGNTMFLGGAETSTGYVNPLDNSATHYSDITDKSVPSTLSASSSDIANLGMYPNESYFTLNSSEIEYHPNYANQLYLGRDNIFYGSLNGGGKFDALHSFPVGSRTLEFEISRENPDIIYCLVSNGGTCFLYKSVNGGDSFSVLPNIPASNRSKLDLTIDPYNSNNVWVISHHASNGQKVYNSLNGGSSWINRTTSVLDGHAILDVLYQAGTDDVVYVTTDFGVFYWDTISNDWIMYADGLPMLTRGLYLRPFYRDSKLRMASSRGIWQAPMAVNSQIMPEPMTSNQTVYCTRDTVLFEDHSIVDHDGVSWSWSFDPEPEFINSNNIRNPKVVFGEDGSFDVTITITHQSGTISKTIEGMVQVESQCLPDKVPGLSLECTEIGDYANIPDLNISQTNQFTISAWIKPDGVQNDYTGIVISDGTTAGFNFISGNTLAYHWPGGQWWWNSGLDVPLGEWSHVAMVAEPNSMTLYVNGQSSTQNILLTPVDIQTMKIGSYKGWESRNFKGEIDEVCLWNKSLNQDEIRELRHLTRTGNTPFTNELIAYYQFNFENEGYIMDKVGTKHGSLSGSASKNVSGAPVGDGSSSRMSVTAFGNYIFPTTGVDLTFSTGIIPNDAVVVSRINVLPNITPNSNQGPTNYWIINNYGNTTVGVINDITFYPESGASVGNLVDVSLYTRTENEDLNNWQEICHALDLTDGAYAFSSNCNISEFGQFFIQSNNANDIYAFDLELNLKVFLEGPLDVNTGLMNDNLRANDHLPLLEPYASFGHQYVSGGNENTSQAVLDTEGSNAIVDWIIVELRDTNDPLLVIQDQVALVQRDGDIVGVDGVSSLRFSQVEVPQVMLAIRHRNHFGFRTSDIYDKGQQYSLDFTNSSVQFYGTESLKDVNGIFVMYAGDANSDGQINAIDKNSYWRLENGVTFDYFNTKADFNMDGGINSVDKNLYWRPNNSKIEQLD